MNKKGQSLAEILIAVGVGSVIIIAVIAAISPALRSNKNAEKLQAGSALARELLENVKTISESDWHKVSNLQTGSSNKYFINSTASPFSVATGTESVVFANVPSLVSHWKFDEAVGTTTIDFGGNGNNGNAQGVTRATSTMGSSLDFPASGSVTVNSSSSLNFGTGSFSVSMWGMYRSFVYPRNSFVIKKSATCYSGAGNPGWDIGVSYNSNGMNYCFSDGVNGGANSSISFDTGYKPTDLQNKWSHLVVVFNRAEGRAIFYVNGKRQSNTGNISAVTGSVDNSSSLVIGTAYGWVTDGRIDDVRIYGKALSDDEVNELYTATPYTRSFYIENVNRDTNGSISLSGTVNDPSTKKITVEYVWPGSVTSSLVRYITRSKNNAYVQSDWSGGPNQTSATSSMNSKFSTSTNVEYSSTTGSIYIPL